MRRCFVNVQDGEIHYRTEGQGMPLLLLHQVPFSSCEFLDVIPHLSSDFEVYAVDFPVFGDSFKPETKLSIERLAVWTVQFLDALGIDNIVVAGHHTGAAVAVELAAVYADRVNKLIVSGCPSFSLEEGEVINYNSQYRKIEVTTDGRFLSKIWSYAAQRIPIDQIEKTYEFMLDFLKAGTRASEGFDAVFSYDILPKLRRITQPTLAMVGDQDILYKFHERTINAISKARSLVLTGGSAQTPRLMPEAWARGIFEFLAH